MKRILAVASLTLLGCPAATTPPPQGPTPSPPREKASSGVSREDGTSRPPAPAPRVKSRPGTEASDDITKPLPCPVDPSQLGFQPVLWPSGSAPNRWGYGVTDITRVRSSKARPVEVCRVRGQLEWLMALRCPDGTSPFATMGAAHGARLGSVGSGGRCGRVIDLYRVPCASGTHEVYLDLYHCTPEGH